MAIDVSVLVPVLNGESTLPTALSSLLAQSFLDWECIVVDDGSDDHTAEVVLNLSDRRIQLVRFEKNRGRGAARQAALEKASGQYIAMLDADDWWYPWKLERQLSFLDDHRDIGIVSSVIALEDPDERISGLRPSRILEEAVVYSQLQSLQDLDLPFAPALIGRDLAKSIGFDPRLRRSEDRLFFAKALSRVVSCCLGEALYCYREAQSLETGGVTSRYGWNCLADCLLFSEYPISASAELGKNLLQVLASALLTAIGKPRLVSRSTPRPPMPREIDEFNLAQGMVRENSGSLEFVSSRGRRT